MCVYHRSRNSSRFVPLAVVSEKITPLPLHFLWKWMMTGAWLLLRGPPSNSVGVGAPLPSLSTLTGFVKLSIMTTLNFTHTVKV